MRRLALAASAVLIATVAPSVAAPAVHADCMSRLPNGNIKLHACDRAKRAAPKAHTKPPRRIIIVVPTGRQLEI